MCNKKSIIDWNLGLGRPHVIMHVEGNEGLVDSMGFDCRLMVCEWNVLFLTVDRSSSTIAKTVYLAGSRKWASHGLDADDFFIALLRRWLAFQVNFYYHFTFGRRCDVQQKYKIDMISQGSGCTWSHIPIFWLSNLSILSVGSIELPDWISRVARSNQIDSPPRINRIGSIESIESTN